MTEKSKRRIIGKNIEAGMVLMGNIWNLGVGRKWFPITDEHKEDPDFADAPETEYDERHYQQYKAKANDEIGAMTEFINTFPRPDCPWCKAKNSWQMGNELYYLSGKMPDTHTDSGRFVPVIAVDCKVCGFLVFFNMLVPDLWKRREGKEVPS